MLTCREMTELASDFLEGRLRWTQGAAARLHLSICENCRRYLRQLRLTIQTIRRARPPEAPVDVERIVAKINRAGTS